MHGFCLISYVLLQSAHCPQLSTLSDKMELERSTSDSKEASNGNAGPERPVIGHRSAGRGQLSDGGLGGRQPGPAGAQCCSCQPIWPASSAIGVAPGSLLTDVTDGCQCLFFNAAAAQLPRHLFGPLFITIQQHSDCMMLSTCEWHQAVHDFLVHRLHMPEAGEAPLWHITLPGNELFRTVINPSRRIVSPLSKRCV